MKGLFSIVLDDSIKKDLERVPNQMVKRFIHLAIQLQRDPFRRRPGADVQRLKGDSDTFRARLGDYRVLYLVDMDSNVVQITAVTHRRAAYRGFVL